MTNFCILDIDSGAAAGTPPRLHPGINRDTVDLLKFNVPPGNDGRVIALSAKVRRGGSLVR